MVQSLSSRVFPVDIVVEGEVMLEDVDEHQVQRPRAFKWLAARQFPNGSFFARSFFAPLEFPKHHQGHNLVATPCDENVYEFLERRHTMKKRT